jgi:hypothetical protein
LCNDYNIELEREAGMSWKVVVRAHVPRGSGDAEYRIESKDGAVLVAVIDPEMAMIDAAAIAERIADAINAAGVFG